jgi:hypothetical protein
MCAAVVQFLEDLYAAVQAPNVSLRVMFVDEWVFPFGGPVFKLDLCEKRWIQLWDILEGYPLLPYPL